MLSSKTGIEDIGKMLIEVQNEVSNIKRQLDSLPNQAGGSQIPPSYSKIQGELSKFEVALKNKAEKFMFGAMQNYGETLNSDSSHLPNLIHDVKSNTVIRDTKNVKYINGRN
jgi:hypothetical protein